MILDHSCRQPRLQQFQLHVELRDRQPALRRHRVTSRFQGGLRPEAQPMASRGDCRVDLQSQLLGLHHQGQLSRILSLLLPLEIGLAVHPGPEEAPLFRQPSAGRQELAVLLQPQ